MSTATKIRNRQSTIDNPAETWSAVEREAWRPPEQITVTEWADRYRYVPIRSAFPGKYSSALTPYMRKPQDAFCDPDVEWIVIMAASQTGKSAAEENMLGFAIDQDPADTLIVVPRDDDISPVAEKKYKLMIQDSPQLARHVVGGLRALQGKNYELDRMTIFFEASGSAAGLSDKTCRIVIFREPDKFPPFAGKEANPIDLAAKRATTFWDSKFVLSCTPTTEFGYTWINWSKSNQQEDYIPCPHCGEYRVWSFQQLRIPKSLRDPDDIIAKNDVWYECEVCGRKIYESEKPKLVAAGIWLPDGQSINADGRIEGTPRRTKRISGFHISAIISPFPKAQWRYMMAAWFEANTEEGIASGKLMDFNNAWLGWIHKPTGKQLRADDVKKTTGFFSVHTVPADCVMLVASADYHKSQKGIVRIDFEVAGFAVGGKNYVVDYGSVTSWKQYDERVFNMPFVWADGTPNEKKPWLSVCCSFEDSKFEPDDVYEHCRERLNFSIPIMGEQGPLLRPLRLTDLETSLERNIKRRRYTKAWYRGMQQMIIDTHFFKRQVTSWAEPTYEEDPDSPGKLKIKSPPLMQTYAGIPSYWFTEFTNEKLVKVLDRRSGLYKYIWQPVRKGAPTHALDLRVYAAAAAHYKGVQYLKAGGSAPARQKRRIGTMHR